MRAFLAILAGVAVAAATAHAATAKTVRAKQTAAAASSSIPVNNYDPAGTYKDYPDWARQAFTPRAGGSSK
jgi:hypothetical protein